MDIFALTIDELYENTERDGTWYADIQINDMTDVFTLNIKNGKAETDIDYFASPYSDEEITKLWEKVEKTDKCKKSMSNALEMVNEIERIKKIKAMEPLIITLISYDTNYEYDIYEFKINKGNLSFFYGIKENNRYDQYTHAIFQSNETDSIMVDHIYFSFSDEVNERIIDALENHPKVKLKRLFRKHA